MIFVQWLLNRNIFIPLCWKHDFLHKKESRPDTFYDVCDIKGTDCRHSKFVSRIAKVLPEMLINVTNNFELNIWEQDSYPCYVPTTDFELVITIKMFSPHKHLKSYHHPSICQMPESLDSMVECETCFQWFLYCCVGRAGERDTVMELSAMQWKKQEMMAGLWAPSLVSASRPLTMTADGR